MENQPFPDSPSDWRWETVEQIAAESYPENTYLEYKSRLQYPPDDEKSKAEWRQNIEREFVAFANASGGYILFGMSDDADIVCIEEPEHELGLAVSQFVQDTTPPVHTEVSAPLRPPDAPPDRFVLAVRVYEATRKPVSTSTSAFYGRMNDQKYPMNRDQIESYFVDADRRQQAIRQLEIEFDRLYDTRNMGRDPFRIHSQEPPSYHMVDTVALKEVLRQNTHLYTNKEAKEAITRIFEELREIEDDEIYVERVLDGTIAPPQSKMESVYPKYRNELQDRIENIERAVRKLAQATDLQVKYINKD